MVAGVYWTSSRVSVAIGHEHEKESETPAINLNHVLEMIQSNQNAFYDSLTEEIRPGMIFECDNIMVLKVNLWYSV